MNPPSRSSRPEPLSPHHLLDDFDSGEASLDEWLKRRARANELEGASRTFVTAASNRAVGYYSVAASAVLHRVAIGKLRRNMPDPVPIVLLGRLAVDRHWQGQGIGADLLRDAVLRTVAAAQSIGIRGLIVHAISDAARAFYEHYGFRVSPIEPGTLMITIAEAAKMV